MKAMIIILLGVYALYSLFPDAVIGILDAVTGQLEWLAANPGILG